MMARMMTGRLVAAVVLAGLIGVGSVQAADVVRVRGTVEAFKGSTLTVKTREGAIADIALKDGWKIQAVAKADVAAIKPGDFVGVASIPREGGGDGALEVLIFPAALKGTGEGSYAWDLQPNSTMTNATVSQAVKSVDGHSLTLTYKGGEKTIAIPEKTPIVTLAPAEPADLTPGATVFVPSEKAADGTLASARVVVGKNGVTPPM